MGLYIMSMCNLHLLCYRVYELTGIVQQDVIIDMISGVLCVHAKISHIIFVAPKLAQISHII